MATRTPGTTRRTPVQTVALVFGVVFLLVGVLGFIPGITQGAEEIAFAGPGSMAMLLGVFHVSVLHNIVHLLLGVAGIALSRRIDSAFMYLVGGGAIYLVLWLYGLVVGDNSAANFVPVNTADDWLHLFLGLGMIALGLLTTRRAVRA